MVPNHVTSVIAVCAPGGRSITQRCSGPKSLSATTSKPSLST
jgi:hypothetical protein